MSQGEEDVGTLIQLVRTERHLTIAQLAAQLAVHPSTLWRWENGRAMPPLSMLRPLCDALRVDPCLFGELPARAWRLYLED